MVDWDEWGEEEWEAEDMKGACGMRRRTSVATKS